MRHFVWIFALSFAFVLVGCDDDPPAGEPVVDMVVPLPRDMGTAPTVDATLPDVMDAEVAETKDAEPDAELEPEADAAATNEFRLVLVGDADHTVFYRQELVLTARLLKRDGTAGAGSIKVRLWDAEGNDQTANGVDGTTIDPHDALTANDGRALFTLTAGQVDTTLTVEASTDHADPIEWHITVARDPKGALAVQVIYPEPARYPVAAFGEITVGLTDADCATAMVGARSGIVLAQPLPAIAPFDGDDVTTGEGLPHGRTFAAVALGKNDRNQVIAAGCTDDVTIIGSETVQAQVALVDEALEYKGTFRVNHELALTEVLRADQNDSLQRLGTILDVLRAVGAEPGQRGPMLVDLACDFGNVDPQACIFLQLLAGPLIDQIIIDAVPPEVVGLLDVIGDLVEIIARFQVTGEMVFAQSRPNENNLLLGNESRWQGIVFAWRDGCAFEDRAQCERTFSLIEDAGLPGRTVVAPFDARVEANDRLTIGLHVMRIDFGRVVLGVLESWILPDALGVQGPVSMNTFFGMLIPCADLNAALPPNDPASGVCEATLIAPLADAVTDAILDLGFGLEVFALQGSVTVADLVPDRQVDALIDGSWDVAFGDAQDPVPEAGIFSGCRVGDCPEDQVEPEPAP